MQSLQQKSGEQTGLPAKVVYSDELPSVRVTEFAEEYFEEIYKHRKTQMAKSINSSSFFGNLELNKLNKTQDGNDQKVTLLFSRNSSEKEKT